MRFVLAFVWCCSAAASAQAVDEDWQAPPPRAVVDAGVQAPSLPPPPLPNEGSFSAPPPSAGAPPGWSAPPPPPSAAPVRPAVTKPSLPYLPPVVLPNRASVVGALPLGPGRLGLQASVGFPIFASLRALVGASSAVDLGLAYETFLGLMHEGRAILRAGGTFERVGFAAIVEAGVAGFITRATRELRGSRWLTGRRNLNASAAGVFSYLGGSARETRISVELRYQLAVDLEPVAPRPLGGPSGGFELLHSLGVRGSFEIPLSSESSVLVQPGFDVRFSASDAPFMPTLAAGFVTAL